MSPNELQAALARIESFARRAHSGAGPAHDYSHVERVLRLAERIALAEGADLFVVRAAAYLHDVGRGTIQGKESRGDRHEEESALMAEPLLRELGVDGPTAARIVEAIRNHRHRKGKGPQALEDECLYDADKLDSLGAVGTARAYLWLGEYGRSVHYHSREWESVDPADNSTGVDSFQREWEIKLRHLQGRMRTATGKALAKERHSRMETILKWIDKEVSGES